MKLYTLYKVDLILRAIQENWGEIFIYSDVDVQFFASVQEDIEALVRGCDMVIQKNSPWRGDVCPGFFAAVGNKRTEALWQDVRSQLLQQKDKHDQDILNDVLIGNSHPLSVWMQRFRSVVGRWIPSFEQSFSHVSNVHEVKWEYLPHTYFKPALSYCVHWVPGRQCDVPKNIVLHHANWTHGVENKIKQLQYVRSVVQARKENKSQ